MSTRFPSFASETLCDSWFSVNSPRDDEVELQLAEEKYRNWLSTVVVKKDSDTPYIGETTSRYCALHTGDEESEEGSNDDDSNEEMEDDDLNELPDSHDEQVIPEIGVNGNEAQEDNSWMNVNH